MFVSCFCFYLLFNIYLLDRCFLQRWHYEDVNTPITVPCGGGQTQTPWYPFLTHTHEYATSFFPFHSTKSSHNVCPSLWYKAYTQDVIQWDWTWNYAVGKLATPAPNLWITIHVYISLVSNNVYMWYSSKFHVPKQHTIRNTTARAISF